ncbi:MAG: BON domain-containing protein [Humidesulfovibrio sp.]|nr:BON domain-containing protein [Humidesulfovibrio sp.]
MQRKISILAATSLATSLALVLALAVALEFTVQPAQAFTPWGAIYDAARDERSVGAITADKKISTSNKSDLVNRDSKLGLAVKVYCYVGRVTLLGQLADEKFKDFAVATAKKTKGVKAVKAHWEAPGKTDTTAADVEIATRIRTALVADKELSATQVEQEVFGGKVYLVGMVRSKKDASRAVAHAKAVKGVTGVVSLLIPSSK